MTDVVELRKRVDELEALFLRKQDAAENYAVAIREVAKKCDVHKKALAKYIQATAKGTKDQIMQESEETVDLIQALEE